MKIESIRICNFRSVKDVTIDIVENGMIIIGKNEAGKSNIIKAIAALFDVYQIQPRDYRKKIDNEKIAEHERYIEAKICLENKDVKAMAKMIGTPEIGYSNAVLPEKFNYENLIQQSFRNITLKKIVKEGEKALIEINEIELDKFFREDKNGGDSYLLTKDGQNADRQFVEWLHKLLNLYYQKNKFICQLWSYKEDYILPPKVPIISFTQNPNNYMPLKNIFLLSGRENIAQEFAESSQQDGDYHNLLDQVSKKATKEFGKIWPDLKGLKIVLEPDGSDIVIKVEEKVKYNFSDRSDGFKHFISIQLMLSTLARINSLDEKNIILIDEPDQGLYPTGAKYLKTELKSIAKKSYVFYTTHSPFMLDDEDIKRHLIVEKEGDITFVKQPEENAPFANDELLRRVIGTTIFECLKPKNIIFEGWLDKELFTKLCNQNDFVGVGMTHLKGIKSVQVLISLLTLAGKKFIVVADSDQVSKKGKQECIDAHMINKEDWMDYEIILGKECTLEDFFKIEYLVKVLTESGYDVSKIEKNKKAIYNIEKCTDGETSSKKDRVMDVKQKLVSMSTVNDVKAEYLTYIAKIKEHLDSM